MNVLLAVPPVVIVSAVTVPPPLIERIPVFAALLALERLMTPGLVKIPGPVTLTFAHLFTFAPSSPTRNPVAPLANSPPVTLYWEFVALVLLKNPAPTRVAESLPL